MVDVACYVVGVVCYAVGVVHRENCYAWVEGVDSSCFYLYLFICLLKYSFIYLVAWLFFCLLILRRGGWNILRQVSNIQILKFDLYFFKVCEENLLPPCTQQGDIKTKVMGQYCPVCLGSVGWCFISNTCKVTTSCESTNNKIHNLKMFILKKLTNRFLFIHLCAMETHTSLI